MGQTKLIYSMLFFDFLTRSPSFSIFQKQTAWGKCTHIRTPQRSAFAPIEITFKMWYHLGKAILGGLKNAVYYKK